MLRKTPYSLVCDMFCFILRSLLSYYGVFDGHAGHRASQYAAQHLHKIIADKLPTGVSLGSNTMLLDP